MAVKINKQKTADAAKEKKSAAKESAPVNESANAKPAANGTKFEKGKKVDSTPKENKKEKRSLRFTERIEFAANLCFKQNLLDEDIKKMVAEKFPNYPVVFDQKEIGRTRWMLKHDMLKNVHADGRQFDRVFLIDGKIVARADKPKTAHAIRKAKYNAESDPLNIIAGVNVHDEKKPVKKEKAKNEKTNEAATA